MTAYSMPMLRRVFVYFSLTLQSLSYFGIGSPGQRHTAVLRSKSPDPRSGGKTIALRKKYPHDDLPFPVGLWYVHKHASHA